VDRHILDVAHEQLVAEEEDVRQEPLPVCVGSSYVLQVSAKKTGPLAQLSYDVVVNGDGVLDVPDLDTRLYSDLVSFIVVFMSKDGVVPTSIQCRSEYVDEHQTIYRAHPNFQGRGFWYDWAWVSYQNDNSSDGYSNVPAKLLCFLPQGLPNDQGNCYVVCHPCKWTSTTVGKLGRKWILDSSKPRVNNGIPYDIVPTSALCGHVLMVPDIEVADTVYEIIEPMQWPQIFISH
jgi:hypothetical protein